jgi:hypothetical protein
LLTAVVTISFLFSQKSESTDSIPETIVANGSEKSVAADSIQIVNQQAPEMNTQELNRTKPDPIVGKPKVRQNSNRAKIVNSKEAINDLQAVERIMESKEGGIFISTYPWAKIYIDGEYRETTPLKKPLQLEAGKYALRLENPNFKSIEQEIIVQPDTIDSANFNLAPLFGFLELQVIPWAEVYINGVYQETTPLNKPLNLPTGKHELKLVNPNLSTWTDSIEIKAGQTYSKKVSLLKQN